MMVHTRQESGAGRHEERKGIKRALQSVLGEKEKERELLIKAVRLDLFPTQRIDPHFWPIPFWWEGGGGEKQG